MADSLNVRRLLRMLRTFMTAPPLRRRIFDSTVAESIAVRRRVPGRFGPCGPGVPEGYPACVRARYRMRAGVHGSQSVNASCR